MTRIDKLSIDLRGGLIFLGGEFVRGCGEACGGGDEICWRIGVENSWRVGLFEGLVWSKGGVSFKLREWLLDVDNMLNGLLQKAFSRGSLSENSPELKLKTPHRRQCHETFLWPNLL